MHDGQNLFDPSRAFMGQTWKAELSLNQLIAKNLIAPIIVVAIDNTSERNNEYTPDFDPEEGVGGNAHDYLELLAYHLKPVIDREFRTINQRNSTAIMGSSLGGLVSIVAGFDFPEIFGLVGALSPSIWWNNSALLTDAMRTPYLPLKIYLDSGDSGGERPQDVQMLSEIFKQRGMRSGKTMKTVIQEGAIHSEKFWAQRLPVALQFLFPPSQF
jgi:predicted alpha/beta superfamily hydrolase